MYSTLLILLLSFTGTLLPSIPIAHATDISPSDPIPHPTLGLQFALGPSPVNGSFVEPLHNSTLHRRQAGNPSAWGTHVRII
ncbi:hypothetical protein BGZ60DRAFT_420566 [Tricladium varicosporioides]|nr:hypothetical protein BGZ60DRAFT_420566 [Hymenoscyphus varicosporioides]